MKISKQYNWNRRDFTYDATCEGCGNEIKNQSGYDDAYFLNTIMPAKCCDNCGESSDSLNLNAPMPTKYNPSEVI